MHVHGQVGKWTSQELQPCKGGMRETGVRVPSLKFSFSIFSCYLLLLEYPSTLTAKYNLCP